ncbi:MAG: sugar phosphate isomerase/epimerase [Methanomicrobiaceae archaeon]|nr:sugar phosphate isomerase/epimerase [Methanomicrobiaceae archaeon]
MSADIYFASSAKVWSSIEWVYGIEETGYDGWEISAEGNFRLDNRESLNSIKEVLETTGLKATVHAPFSDLNLASFNYPIYKESIRQLCECIRFSSEITEYVTVHPGYMSPEAKLVPDKVWSLHKEALAEIGKLAEEYGVRVGLENMPAIPGFLCIYPDELFGMIHGIDNVGATVDVGHANTAGELKSFLARIGEAAHLHLHDNNGEHDDHLPLGQGNIDWEMVFDRVSKDYRGIFVVEGRSIEEAAISLEFIRRFDL